MDESPPPPFRLLFDKPLSSPSDREAEGERGKGGGRPDFLSPLPLIAPTHAMHPPASPSAPLSPSLSSFSADRGGGRKTMSWGGRRNRVTFHIQGLLVGGSGGHAMYRTTRRIGKPNTVRNGDNHSSQANAWCDKKRQAKVLKCVFWSTATTNSSSRSPNSLPLPPSLISLCSLSQCAIRFADGDVCHFAPPSSS